MDDFSSSSFYKMHPDTGVSPVHDNTSDKWITSSGQQCLDMNL